MTESTPQQKLQQIQPLNTESLKSISEAQPEIPTEELGNEAENAEFRVNLETHPWEHPEFKDDSNIKSYKELASKYGVSTDTIRKDLKKIATICEDFGASYNLTRKEGRKVLVTAEGQCELCKYRELGADAYRQGIEAFWGTEPEEDETTELYGFPESEEVLTGKTGELNEAFPAPQSPKEELPGQLAQARPQNLAESPRESKTPAAIAKIQQRAQNVGQQSTALTQQTANQQRNTLEQAQMRGGMQGVDAAAIEAQAMRQAYSKASGQFAQDFWNSLEDGFASATDIDLATPEVDEYLGKSDETLQTSRETSQDAMTDLWQGLSSSLNL